MTVPTAAAAGSGAATAAKSAKLFSFGLLSDVQVRSHDCCVKSMVC